MKKILATVVVIAIMLTTMPLLDIVNATEDIWTHFHINGENFNYVVGERRGNIVYYDDYLNFLFHNVEPGQVVSVSLYFDEWHIGFQDTSQLMFSSEETVLQAGITKNIVFPTFREMQRTVNLPRGVYWIVAYVDGVVISGWTPVFLTESSSYIALSFNGHVYQALPHTNINSRRLPFTFHQNVHIGMTAELPIRMFRLNKMRATGGNEGFDVLMGEVEKNIITERFSYPLERLEHFFSDLEDGLYTIDIEVGPFWHTKGFRVDNSMFTRPPNNATIDFILWETDWRGNIIREIPNGGRVAVGAWLLFEMKSTGSPISTMSKWEHGHIGSHFVDWSDTDYFEHTWGIDARAGSNMVTVTLQNGVTSSFTFYVYDDGDSPEPQPNGVGIMLNGKLIGFEDTEPQIIDNSTMVPIRFIAEELGADVSWNDETREVTLTFSTANLTLSLTFTIGEKISGMDVPAQIISDRTFVPLRFIGEFFGAEVDWDGKSQMVIITTE